MGNQRKVKSHSIGQQPVPPTEGSAEMKGTETNQSESSKGQLYAFLSFTETMRIKKKKKKKTKSTY